MDGDRKTLDRYKYQCDDMALALFALLFGLFTANTIARFKNAYVGIVDDRYSNSGLTFPISYLPSGRNEMCIVLCTLNVNVCVFYSRTSFCEGEIDKRDENLSPVGTVSLSVKMQPVSKKELRENLWALLLSSGI